MMFIRHLRENPKAIKILLIISITLLLGGLIMGLFIYFSPKSICARQTDKLLENVPGDGIKDRNYMKLLRDKEIESCLEYRKSSIKR